MLAGALFFSVTLAVSGARIPFFMVVLLPFCVICSIVAQDPKKGKMVRQSIKELLL